MKKLKGPMASSRPLKAAATRSMPTLQDRAKMAMKARSMGPKARPMASRAMRNRPSLVQSRSTRKAR